MQSRMQVTCAPGYARGNPRRASAEKSRQRSWRPVFADCSTHAADTTCTPAHITLTLHFRTFGSHLRLTGLMAVSCYLHSQKHEMTEREFSQLLAVENLATLFITPLHAFSAALQIGDAKKEQSHGAHGGCYSASILLLYTRPWVHFSSCYQLGELSHSTHKYPIAAVSIAFAGYFKT